MSDMAKVCAVVARQLGLAQVSPDQRLIEDLAAESLDYVTIALALETAFGVWIPDDLLYEIDVVGDFARALDATSGARGA
ncbi:MAG: phosphopantetheine-binding protein [Caulobacterales bacterium]